MAREHGFVAAASIDWSLSQATLPISLFFAGLGVGASLSGKWQRRVGIRKTLITSSFLFGGGFLVGSAGIYLHSLVLLYLGFGVMSGIGCGLGYTGPIGTIIQWFPDKRGLASGICIAGVNKMKKIIYKFHIYFNLVWKRCDFLDSCSLIFVLKVLKDTHLFRKSW